MKDVFVLCLALLTIAFVGLGCGLVTRLQDSVTGSGNTNSNRTLTDKGIETTIGEEKIGVPECDEVMDLLTTEANNPDDSFVVKAGKGWGINKIKEAIRTSVEENGGDKVEMAKDCRRFKSEFEKYKAEQEKEK